MKFFEFIYKYYGYFFWGEIAYVALVLALCILLEMPEWLSVICMLPLNLISWPVLVASEKAEHQRAKSRQGGPRSIEQPVNLLSVWLYYPPVCRLCLSSESGIFELKYLPCLL